MKTINGLAFLDYGHQNRTTLGRYITIIDSDKEPPIFHINYLDLMLIIYSSTQYQSSNFTIVQHVYKNRYGQPERLHFNRLNYTFNYRTITE